MTWSPPSRDPLSRGEWVENRLRTECQEEEECRLHRQVSGFLPDLRHLRQPTADSLLSQRRTRIRICGLRDRIPLSLPAFSGPSLRPTRPAPLPLNSHLTTAMGSCLLRNTISAHLLESPGLLLPPQILPFPLLPVSVYLEPRSQPRLFPSLLPLRDRQTAIRQMSRRKICSRSSRPLKPRLRNSSKTTTLLPLIHSSRTLPFSTPDSPVRTSNSKGTD